MTNPALVAFPKDFSQLQSQLEAWRRNGRPGRRIPTALWRAATEAARERGTGHVATVLRLDYTKLKRLVENLGQEASAEPKSGATFFELPPAHQARADQGTVLEFEAADGATIVVRLPPGERAELTGLAAQLWERRP